MIFVMCKHSGDYNFTGGRIYLATPEVDNPTVVDMDFIILNDDNGQEVRVNTDDDIFDYPDVVYACVLKSFDGKSSGDVVKLDGIGDGGDFLSVVGHGYMTHDHFQILDMCVVRPGMVVYDSARYVWDMILRVDDDLRISVECNDLMQSVDSFMFSVVDGDLCEVPLLRCCDDSGVDTLEEGKIYRISGLDESGCFLVVDDTGSEQSFLPDRFVFV